MTCQCTRSSVQACHGAVLNAVDCLAGQRKSQTPQKIELYKQAHLQGLK